MPLSRWTVVVTAIVVSCCAGCEKGQHVVPYSGKVQYKNQPLTSGSIMFQPEGGIPARGTIGPDGSFTLSTYDEGDGATVGKNKVRVVSTTSVNEDPTKGELATGTSTIPEKYSDFSTSPLTVEVAEPGSKDAVLKLED